MSLIGQILLGMGVIVLSVLIQVIFIEVAARQLRKRFGPRRQGEVSFTLFVGTLTAVTTWLLIGLMHVVTLWAFLFLKFGIFTTAEESFYFALVAFTTLGFGDVIPPEQWRVISGFVATDGFILFGLNTAVLLEIIFRLRGRLDTQ